MKDNVIVIRVPNMSITCMLCHKLVLIVHSSRMYAEQQMGWLMRNWIEGWERKGRQGGMSPMSDWWLDIIKTEGEDWLQHGGRLAAGQMRGRGHWQRQWHWESISCTGGGRRSIRSWSSRHESRVHSEFRCNSEFRCKAEQGTSCNSNRDTGVFIRVSHLRVKERVLFFPSICSFATPQDCLLVASYTSQ